MSLNLGMRPKSIKCQSDHLGFSSPFSMATCSDQVPERFISPIRQCINLPAVSVDRLLTI